MYSTAIRMQINMILGHEVIRFCFHECHKVEGKADQVLKETVEDDEE